MAPPYRAYGGAHRREPQAGFPWVVKAMMAVMVVAAFVAVVVIWAQSGAPSQFRAASADSAGPHMQDGGSSTMTE